MATLKVVFRIVVVRLGVLLASMLPVRERVLLATGHKRQLDGNLASIQTELQQRLPRTAVVTLAFEPGRGPLAHVGHAIREFAAAYQVRRSRVVIVDDYFFPLYPVRRRRGTTVIQTWHASGAFKKFGLSLADHTFGSDAALTSRVHIHSNYSVCLASSALTAKAYAEAFGQPMEQFVWDTGIPRTDLLFNVDEERLAAVRSSLGVPADRRVILYAPTFRGLTTNDARAPHDLELAELRRQLGADHVLLLRFHPYVRGRESLAGLGDFVIDVSDYPEISDLMLISDVLISDYSSAIFEFSLLGRPIVLFAPDDATYERERGFYFDYRAEGPGPVFEATDDLARHLRAGEFDTERVKRFAERWFTVADGRSTQRVVERLVLPALPGQLA
jgi:CDP-glycerol glycerophosphotransferase (TagB/SpsB family)